MDSGGFSGRKVVVVGDGYCGKTTMLLSYTTSEWPDSYVPTVCELCKVEVKVAGETVNLSLLDTAGQEEYDRLRTMVYCNAHVVIVCFAVDDRNSYDNVRNKWLPEIAQFCPNVSIVLVATKIDLRGESGPNAADDTATLSPAEGRELANDVSAAAYVECSSRLKQGLNEVFEAAAKAALGSKCKNGKKEKEKKLKSGNNKDDRCTVS